MYVQAPVAQGKFQVPAPAIGEEAVHVGRRGHGEAGPALPQLWRPCSRGGVVHRATWSEPDLMEWFVQSSPGQAPLGPLSTELVVAGIQTGRIPVTAQVCAEGSNEWQPLTRVHEFGAAAIGLSPPSQQPPQPQVQEGRGCVATTVRFTVFLLFAALFFWGAAKFFLESNAPKIATPSVQDGAVEIGSEVSLRIPESDSKVLVYPSKESYDKSVKAAAAKDRQGFDEASKSAYPVQSGTAALVLEYVWIASYKVRIKEGPWAGKTGYVEKEFLQKKP